ncbi:hypothetical protein DRJ17_04345 [Candidatus Woesearchaeota archaeon]|nr:MAG: hypothetical protein DRJ17_04345 [Candidatus Woesearchaeota archaeon]
MKICLLTANFITGRGYQENHWADVSLALGHELLIVTTDLKHKDLQNEISDKDMYGEGLVRLKAVRLPFNIVRIKRGLIYSLLDEFAPELILLIGYTQYFGLDAFRYKRKMNDRTKLVVFNGECADMHRYWRVHRNLRIKDLIKSIGWRFLRGPVIKAAVGRADSVICATPDTEAIIKTVFSDRGTESNNGKLLYCPLSYDGSKMFYNDSLREQTRATFGIRDKDVLLLASTRIRADKLRYYLRPMVEGVARFIKGRDYLRFVLVGFTDEAVSSKFKVEVELLFGRKGLVTLPIADQDYLNALYNAADIVIFSTVSNSIQQAMGSGAYILLSDNVGRNYIINEKDQGMYFNLREPGSLERCIEEAVKCYRNISRPERAKMNSWLESKTLYGSLLERLKE